MKLIKLLAVAPIFFSSCKDENTVNIDIDNKIDISLLNSSAKDLLDPKTQGFIDQKTIKTISFGEDPIPNVTSSINHQYMTPDYISLNNPDSAHPYYRISVYPKATLSKSYLVLNWNKDEKPDTLLSEFERIDNRIVCKKVYLNNSLVWTPEDKKERILSITKHSKL